MNKGLIVLLVGVLFIVAQVSSVPCAESCDDDFQICKNGELVLSVTSNGDLFACGDPANTSLCSRLDSLEVAPTATTDSGFVYNPDVEDNIYCPLQGNLLFNSGAELGRTGWKFSESAAAATIGDLPTTTGIFGFLFFRLCAGQHISQDVCINKYPTGANVVFRGYQSVGRDYQGFIWMEFLTEEYRTISQSEALPYIVTPERLLQFYVAAAKPEGAFYARVWVNSTVGSCGLDNYRAALADTQAVLGSQQAYYTFDDDTYDISTNDAALDSSQNGNNAYETFAGASPASNTQPIGADAHAAHGFDPASFSVDFGSIYEGGFSVSNIFGPVVNPTYVSFEFWIRSINKVNGYPNGPTDPQLIGSANIVNQIFPDSSNAISVRLVNYASTEYVFIIYRGADATETAYAGSVLSPAGVADDGWHHVVCTKSPTDMIVYIDGILAFDNVQDVDFVTNNPGPNSTIGTYDGFDDYVEVSELNAFIDELTVYAANDESGVLDPDTVDAHYSAFRNAAGFDRMEVGVCSDGTTPTGTYTPADYSSVLGKKKSLQGSHITPKMIYEKRNITPEQMSKYKTSLLTKKGQVKSLKF